MEIAERVASIAAISQSTCWYVRKPLPSPPDRSIVTGMGQDENKRDSGTLTDLTARQEREVMHRWRKQTGMDGPRRTADIETPDDPVAFKLLDAAGDAIGKGEVRQGVGILKLVAKVYRDSQEAALARQALDRLSGHSR